MRYNELYLRNYKSRKQQEIYRTEEGTLQSEYLGSGAALKNAISKYGEENFVVEIIEVVDNK